MIHYQQSDTLSLSIVSMKYAFKNMKLRALYTLKSSNFARIYHHMAHNSRRKYVLFKNDIKTILYPFLNPLKTFPYNLSPPKLGQYLQYSLNI